MSFAENLIKLRKEKGMTQEELAFEVGVSRQSVSKWETGEAEPNVSTLKSLANIFDVSLDSLLGDTVEVVATAQSQPPLRKVTVDEAKALIATSRKNAPLLALATLLCILSPVCLILLGGLSEDARFSISEGMAGGIGMIVLLVMIATAVAIFIVCNGKSARFSYFEKEPFEIETAARALAEEKKEGYKNAYARKNILGACLCILSLIPLFIGIMINENDDLLLVILTACIFPLAGLGVFFFVWGATIWGSFERLLQFGEYTKKKKAAIEARGTLSLIYWLVVTAVFLAIALPLQKWQYVGIIWVIAGVLYPVALAIFDAVNKKKK